jgi:hypothetical protein
VLQRLIKGLGSGRGACRQGFAAALALVLEEAQSIPNADVLNLMEEHLPLLGNGKGTVCGLPSFPSHQPTVVCSHNTKA